MIYIKKGAVFKRGHSNTTMIIFDNGTRYDYLRGILSVDNIPTDKEALFRIEDMKDYKYIGQLTEEEILTHPSPLVRACAQSITP